MRKKVVWEREDTRSGCGDDCTFVHYCIGWRSAWDRCHERAEDTVYKSSRHLDGEHVVGTSSRAFDVKGWTRGDAIASHTTNPMSLLPLKRACAPSLLPIS